MLRGRAPVALNRVVIFDLVNMLKLQHLLARLTTHAMIESKELSAVNTSINVLQDRLNKHFDCLHSHFQFGSSVRLTNLPQSLDQDSDVDYMVVFNKQQVLGQTYLDRLRRFAEKYYTKSEIRQSHPTIVLRLAHIKFELVPARRSFLGDFHIPDNSGNWVPTNPNNLNRLVQVADRRNHGLILPTIRLMKIWNINNGRVFSSFELEEWVAERNYLFVNSNLQGYFFHVIKSLPSGRSKTTREKVWMSKDLVNKALRAERSGNSKLAIDYIKELLVVKE